MGKLSFNEITNIYSISNGDLASRVAGLESFAIVREGNSDLIILDNTNRLPVLRVRGGEIIEMDWAGQWLYNFINLGIREKRNTVIFEKPETTI